MLPPDESIRIDAWLLRLSTQAGVRVTREMAVRELLRMARATDSPLHEVLVHRLRDVAVERAPESSPLARSTARSPAISPRRE